MDSTLLVYPKRRVVYRAALFCTISSFSTCFSCRARKWGMRFQPVKCNMMQLTNKRSSKIQANYTLEGTVLENIESIKYLGVTITNDLKWNTHISNVCTKANRILRRQLYSCPPDVKEAAYKGLVRPVLEYGSSVWDPHTHGLQEELKRSKIVRQGL